MVVWLHHWQSALKLSFLEKTLADRCWGERDSHHPLPPERWFAAGSDSGEETHLIVRVHPQERHGWRHCWLRTCRPPNCAETGASDLSLIWCYLWCGSNLEWSHRSQAVRDFWSFVSQSCPLNKLEPHHFWTLDIQGGSRRRRTHCGALQVRGLPIKEWQMQRVQTKSAGRGCGVEVWCSHFLITCFHQLWIVPRFCMFWEACELWSFLGGKVEQGPGEQACLRGLGGASQAWSVFGWILLDDTSVRFRCKQALACRRSWVSNPNFTSRRVSASRLNHGSRWVRWLPAARVDSESQRGWVSQLDRGKVECFIWNYASFTVIAKILILKSTLKCRILTREWLSWPSLH